MSFDRAFFDMQFAFARKAGVLTGLPLQDALLSHTNFYIRFGLGRDFDPQEETWRRYLEGVGKAVDPEAWTYRFYLSRLGTPAGPAAVSTHGCFSYEMRGDLMVKLHFENTEVAGLSPLSFERAGRRRDELAALFSEIRGSGRSPLQVVGASWLYHLAGYRRLFPPAYLATAEVTGPHFQRMSLWGQFLHRDGSVRTREADLFKARLRKVSTAEDLGRCFRLHTLILNADVAAFYDFYLV